jgi:hypothetical protein
LTGEVRFPDVRGSVAFASSAHTELSFLAGTEFVCAVTTPRVRSKRIAETRTVMTVLRIDG